MAYKYARLDREGNGVPKPNLDDNLDYVQKQGARNRIIEILGLTVMRSKVCWIVYRQTEITLYNWCHWTDLKIIIHHFVYL